MLEQTYYFSGIIAAIGVVATLLYLAREVQNNTRAMQANTGHAVTEEVRSLFNMVSQRDAVSGIFWKGCQNTSNLEGVELFRFYAICHYYFHSYQNAYLQMKSGALDDRYWSAAFASLSHMVLVPGIRIYWEDRKNWYGDEFKNYVDQEMDKDPTDLDYKLAGT